MQYEADKLQSDGTLLEIGQDRGAFKPIRQSGLRFHGGRHWEEPEMWVYFANFLSSLLFSAARWLDQHIDF